MASPSEFFAPWEQTIGSWLDLQNAINELTARYPNQRLLWRGASNAGWGVESSLFRSLKLKLETGPTEDQMVQAEKQILKLAREEWRFDGMGALETFANLQHLGGPTRLLDVTENPLIAAWFGSQPSKKKETDARLFAFVTPERDIRLNEHWGGRRPWWHDWSNNTDDRRRKNKWGTGRGRRFWRPPAYDARVSSQSAGFLIDGVPIESTESGFGRRRPESEDTWSVEEMRDFGSIPLKLTKAREGRLASDAAPVFTYRIAAAAKEDVRNQLQDRYGYRPSSIYSDLYGLAEYLRERPEVWAP